MRPLNFEIFPEIETERLKLVRITEAYLDDLYDILGDPKVAEYDYFYPVENREAAQKFIDRYDNEIQENEELTWGVCLKETHELIGTCCLGSFDEKAQRAEVGYAFKQKEWNKGYATEALKAVIAYGFKEVELNRIEATITPGNDSSVRVLEKLGFVKEGLVRERDYLKGQLVDGIIMSMLAREYV